MPLTRTALSHILIRVEFYSQYTDELAMDFLTELLSVGSVIVHVSVSWNASILSSTVANYYYSPLSTFYADIWLPYNNVTHLSECLIPWTV